jgi:hypothetical protein
MKRYIDADKFIEYLGFANTKEERNENIYAIVTLQDLDNQIAEDVQEVKHGKNLAKAHPVNEFICSECGYMTEDCTEKKYSQDGDYCYLCGYEYKFCPNCGAKMDKE